MAASSPLLVSEAASTARIRLRCWGDFGLTHGANGADLKPRGRKARALLAYLAFHGGKPVSRERLTGLLWGDRGEEQARASLRQAILELKPILGVDDRVLSIERDHLMVHAAAVVTDIEEMQAVVARGDYDGFLGMLPDSDERLFANLDGMDEALDSWLAIERARQHDALVTLIADASAAALAKGQTRHARALHARLLEFDPAAGSLTEVPVAAAAAPAVPAVTLEPAGDPTWPRRRTVGLALLLMFLVAIGAALWTVSRRGSSPATTIAVLPFKSSSAPDASFAEGLSEEITAQLARQPGLHVAGRTSADRFADGRTDLGEIGRKLHVSYVLEGSVRSAGKRIRVTVALAKTSDGLQLWSNSFDGTLDDVLNIQYRIGASVAQALNLKLSGHGPPTGALATSGQVYSLYLSARGLIRERNGVAFGAAQEKLRLAVQLDPNFAPAWSSLAQTENPGGIGPHAREAMARAIADANRALELAPDLAEAHGVLGMLYGFDHPLGRQHIARAAELDPNNAEFQFWLGNVYAVNADFARMLDAYRRAYLLDPLWHFAQEYVVRAAWQMGYRDEALAEARRIESDGSAYQAHLIRAVLAEARGDFSETARQYAEARDAASDPGRRADAEWALSFLLERLGLFDAAYTVQRRANWPGAPPEADPYVLLRNGRLPTAAEFRQRNSNIAYSWQDAAFVGRAAKMLVNAGRAKEIVSLYDGEGVMRMSRRSPVSLSDRTFEDGPTVAAALRAVGRTDEADRVLQQLDAELNRALRRSGGRAPSWFFALAARTWALRGKADAAMDALDRAMANGWAYSTSELDDSSLADFGDEPAFRSLRGNPRFEGIRARINAHLMTERREAFAQLGSTI